jgi:site-specific recombinase XerD
MAAALRVKSRSGGLVERLSSILSQQEVSLLIESAPAPFQRTLLMALYATGRRRAELARKNYRR